MTKEEFKSNYCKRSHITEEFFDKHFVIEKCECGEDECNGWAVISNANILQTIKEEA